MIRTCTVLNALVFMLCAVDPVCRFLRTFTSTLRLRTHGIQTCTLLNTSCSVRALRYGAICPRSPCCGFLLVVLDLTCTVTSSCAGCILRTHSCNLAVFMHRGSHLAGACVPSVTTSPPYGCGVVFCARTCVWCMRSSAGCRLPPSLLTTPSP